MKRRLTLLLSALLLCGLFVFRCDGVSQSMAASEAQRLPVSVTLVSAESFAPSAKDGQPLSLTEAGNTMWSNTSGVRLMIYEDGAAYLFTANEVFTLKTDDDGFVLQLEMYRTAFDTEPVAVLPAGRVRILQNDDVLTLEVVDDPAGILVFVGLDGAVLTKDKYTPYPYTSFNFFSGPVEPGTEWSCYFQRDRHGYAKLSMTVGEDGAMSGTLTMMDGTERACVLFGNDNGFALVTDTERKADLIFLGERRKVHDNNVLQARYELVWLDLVPVFDHLGLTVEDQFELGREMGEEGDLRYMLGRNLDSVILSLIRDGWMDTTVEVGELHHLLEGWFARLIKDGQTLMIYYEPDFSSPYEIYQEYLTSYVLYGADGAVLGWAGEKPIDHDIADAYRLQKGVYFDPGIGIWGMDVGEDEYAYFLDDGRIAIEYTPHEGGDGDIGFEIVKVIP